MAQNIINYGASANDGEGDSLRNAFIKTDDNFDQIWATGPVGSNVTILNNTIGVVNTNGNLILSPNGIGIIQTNRPLYPRLDNTYNLGSPELRYRSIFVGSGGITANGNLTLGSISNLRIPGGQNGYVIQTDGNSTLSWVALPGSGNGAPGGANLQVQYNANGLFGGSTNFTFNPATSNLTVGNAAVGNISTRTVYANILSVNTAGNTWSINNQILTAPSGATWLSNTATLDDYISSAIDGYINLQTYNASSNIAAQFHLEHGLAHINILNGVDYTWEFNNTGLFSAPGNITANGNVTANYFLGNGSQLSNLPGGVIQGEFPPESPNDTTLWWDDVTGRLYVWYTDVDGSQWVDAAPAAPGSTYGNANVAAYLASGNNSANIVTTGGIVAVSVETNKITSGDSTLVVVDDGLRVGGDIVISGDIIPDTSNVYSLGSSTNQWADLYVANATIYMNNVPISLGAGNVLTVNGNAVLTNNSNTTVSTTGNLAAGNLTVSSGSDSWTISGQFLTGPGGAYWHSHPEQSSDEFISAPGSDITIKSIDSNSVLASQISLTSTDIEIIVVNGVTKTWRFNDSGTSEIPGDIVPIVTLGASANVGNITNPWDNAYISGNISAGNVSATGNIAANNFIGLLGNITNLDSVNFAVENIGALVGNNGVNIGAGGYNNLVVLPTDVLIQNVPLTVAGNILSTVAGGLNITANTVANGIAQIWNFGTDGRLTFPGTPRIDTDANNFEVQAAEAINFEANAVVNIYTDTSGTTYQWQFDDTGNLILPAGGNIIVDGGDGVIGPDGDNMVISWDNEDLILRSVGSDVDVEADRDFNIRVNYDVGATDYLTKWVFGQDNEIINITGNSAIITEAGNLNLQGGRNTLSSGNVQITAVDNGVAVNTWTFDNTGNLTAPGDITTSGNISVDGSTNISNVTINSYTSVPQLWFKGQISSPQNVTSSTDTVTLWNDNTDPQSWGNVTTGHITPNKSGWYEITSRVQFNTNDVANSQQQINHQIAVNGNQQAISQLPNLTGNVPVTMIATAMVEINGTTDYITTTCWSSVAGNAQQINGGNTSSVIVRWVST